MKTWIILLLTSINYLNAQSIKGKFEIGNQFYSINTTEKSVHIMNTDSLNERQVDYSDWDSIVRDYNKLYLLKNANAILSIKLLDANTSSAIINEYCDSFKVINGGLLVFKNDSMGVLSQGRIKYVNPISDYCEILFSKYDMFLKYGLMTTDYMTYMHVLTRDLPILMSESISPFLNYQLYILGNDSVVYFGAKNKIEFMRTIPRFMDFDSSFICFLDNGEKPIIAFLDSGLYAFPESNSLYDVTSNFRWYIGDSRNKTGTGTIEKINSKTGTVKQSHKISEPPSGAVFLNNSLYISTYTGKILQLDRKYKVRKEYDYNKTSNIKRLKFTGITAVNTSEIAASLSSQVSVFSKDLEFKGAYPTHKQSAFVDLFSVYNTNHLISISGYKNTCSMYTSAIRNTIDWKSSYKCILCDEAVDEKAIPYPMVLVMGVDSNFVYVKDKQKLNKYSAKDKQIYNCSDDSAIESKYLRYFKTPISKNILQLEMAKPMALDSFNMRLKQLEINDYQCSRLNYYDCIESRDRLFLTRDNVELIIIDLTTKKVIKVDLNRPNMYLITLLPNRNGECFLFYGSIPKYNAEGNYADRHVVKFFNSVYNRKFDSLQISGKSIVLKKGTNKVLVPVEKPIMQDYNE